MWLSKSLAGKQTYSHIKNYNTVKHKHNQVSHLQMRKVLWLLYLHSNCSVMFLTVRKKKHTKLLHHKQCTKFPLTYPILIKHLSYFMNYDKYQVIKIRVCVTLASKCLTAITLLRRFK